MTAPHPEILIVRRRSSTEDEDHGGAWKIAFADFMTAMMAFFLVLWIISATDKNTKTVIARYFNPVKVEEPAKAQKGIRGVPEPEAGAGHAQAPPNPDNHSGESPAAHEAAHNAPPAEPAEEAKHNGPAPSETKASLDPAQPKPTMSEQQLFSDPGASLDAIAGRPEAGPKIDSSSAPKGFGDVGPSPDDAIRDPFRPMGGGRLNESAPEPKPAAGPAASEAREPKTPPFLERTLLPPKKEGSAPEPAKAGEAQPQNALGKIESPGASTRTGLSSEPNKPPGTGQAELKAPPEQAKREAAARLLAEVKGRLGAEAQAAPGPQLEVRATDEGILISVTDRQNFAMFAIGSAEPQPRMLRMMDAIAASLKSEPGAIVLRGHTDAHPYRSQTYDNWRLSSARAQMAYYMLTRAGIGEKRFERIEGFADHRLKDPAHPLAAENRRIEILLREDNP